MWLLFTYAAVSQQLNNNTTMFHFLKPISMNHSTSHNLPQQTRPLSIHPFSIHIEHLDVAPNGYFRPSAFLRLNADIRTSGFLLAMPAEELKSFLFLLSFSRPTATALLP